MQKTLFTALALGALVAACNCDSACEATTAASVSDASPAPKIAELGAMAPNFTLRDLNGKEVKLSDFRGKTVVLEWFNPQCPFVVYAYEKGPLGDMADNWDDKDVVWLSINSGAPGMQGAGMDVNKGAMSKWHMKSHVLLDESGDVGRTYQAKTTPHMFVVDKNGMLVYQGALDNAPTGRLDGEYTNYVENALMAVTKGREVSMDDTKPYGCSVKYAK